MKAKSNLFILLPLGKNQLLFNLHYIFEFDTIISLFKNWQLKDYFVDKYVHFNKKNYLKLKDRFLKNIDVSQFAIGEYKIIYLHFSRK